MELVGHSCLQTCFFRLNHGRDVRGGGGRRKQIERVCIVFSMGFLEMFCLLLILKKKNLLLFKQLLKLVNRRNQNKLRKLIVNQAVLLA